MRDGPSSTERHSWIGWDCSLHLATALLLGEPVVVATHDRTMKDVAAHLGLEVLDPVDRVG